MTFLVRRLTVFDADETMQSYVRSGKARLVKGDALDMDAVVRGYAKAQAAHPSGLVDVVLCSLGTPPLILHRTDIF